MLNANFCDDSFLMIKHEASTQWSGGVEICPWQCSPSIATMVVFYSWKRLSNEHQIMAWILDMGDGEMRVHTNTHTHTPFHECTHRIDTSIFLNWYCISLLKASVNLYTLYINFSIQIKQAVEYKLTSMAWVIRIFSNPVKSEFFVENRGIFNHRLIADPPLQHKQHLLVRNIASFDHLALMTKDIVKVSPIKKRRKTEQNQLKTIWYLSTSAHGAGARVVRGRCTEKLRVSLCTILFFLLHLDLR